MVGIIDGFRWSLLRGAVPIWWPGLLISTAVTLLLCYAGIRYFRHTEKTFADVI
jgi:lipopolysaccharide transport system permease protein